MNGDWRTIVATRSLPRRAGAWPSRRPRSVLLRIAFLASIAALIGLPAYAVAVRLFPKDGPGRILYWLHDAVYIPLAGSLWTGLYPYAFLWALPAAVLAILVIGEFLKILNIVRFVHRRAIRALLPFSWGRKFIAARLDPGGRRVGRSPRDFAHAVVSERQAELRNAAIHSLGSENVIDRRLADQMLDIGELRFQLSQADGAAAIELLEVVAFVGLAESGRAEANRRLGAPWIIERIKSALDEKREAMWFHVLASLTADDRGLAVAETALSKMIERLEGALRSREDVQFDPVAAAAMTLLAAHLACRKRLHSTRLFFTLWAALRATAPGCGLPEAETLVSFSFWSALSEQSATRPPLEGLLAQVLASPERDLAIGERFAWEGTAS